MTSTLLSADTRPGAVLVVDFGAQYAQLIARRVREADVYSEIVPHTMPAAEMLAREPAAIILSGGPASVYAADAPALEEAVVTSGVPVLGICYGFQAMARALGGTVARTGGREYGETSATVSGEGSTLFAGQPAEQVVWMSHGDAVDQAPAGCQVTASTPGAPVAAFEDDERRLYGVQWHPEVLHTAHGQQVLVNFLRHGAGIEPTWTSGNVVEQLVEEIRAQVGEDRVICGLSGGVDSSVAAALVQRAVGDQLTCVFVDHGLLREGEVEQVEQDFVAATGVDLVTVDARERFLSALAGVSDPEEKRKAIGREFIRVFEQAARDIVRAHDGEHGDPDDHPVKWLVQGTLYPDVVESGGGAGTANIKSHHNVGGLPDDIQFQLIEPLRALFKDEVRHRPRTGRARGHRLPPAVPRPGPGRAHPRRGHRGAPEHPAQGRCDRPRRADEGRPRRRDLAVPGRAPGRCPLRRRPGRRPHLRPPRRAAPGLERGRDDRRLDAHPLRCALRDLQPHHQRGRRHQPRRPRRHLEASGHDRMGVMGSSLPGRARTTAALTAGKVARAVSRLRGGGSALPGLVCERIDPHVLRHTLGALPRGVVVVSGTNGKTTTTKMLVALLRAHGLRVFTNPTGSNFTRGVISSMLAEIGVDGRLDADVAVVELDEAHALHFAAEVPPTHALLLNVARDQLDRFAEIDHTARLLTTLAEQTTSGVVLNADDSFVSRIRDHVGPGVRVGWFGVDGSVADRLPELQEADVRLAEGEARPELGSADGQLLPAEDGRSLTIRFGDGQDVGPLELRQRGLAAMINATAATTTARHLLGDDFRPDVAATALAAVNPPFGRGEVIDVHGAPLELVLVKNPAGFTVALGTYGGEPVATMVAINDDYADGRDVSWLYDVSFESLRERGVALTSGVRGWDMALRLRYDGVEVDEVVTDLDAALERFLTQHQGQPTRIFCTYTAMMHLRRQLADRFGLARFGEDPAA